MRLIVGLMVVCALTGSARAQAPVFSDPEVSGPAPPDRAATLTYLNRPLVELRAQVLSRMPVQRAAAAVHALDEIVARGVASPVSARNVGGAFVIAVGGESVLVIVPADVDVLAGETLEGVANETVFRLRVALAEAVEARAPGQLLWGIVQSAAVTGLLFVLLWSLRRLDRIASGAIVRAAERRMGRSWSGQAMRITHLPHVLQGGTTAALGGSALVLTYLWLAFILRRFPYTRPFGESLRQLLFSQVALLGAAVLDAMPRLFTVALIILAARWAAKALTLLFNAVEQGRVSLPGIYPDTAVPTRRLLIVLLWLAALGMAYPYIPGSDSSGVKGISLFIGVVVSLGSTGVVQHLMAGLTLTFARAMRVGEFARIGDVEGTILQIGALATKVLTPLGEEITIPNAVVMSQMTTNYSRGAGTEAALLSTSVTIGYDTPWRQVESLLLLAAQQTAGVCQAPRPIVRRVSLEDYYVKYSLLVLPEDPCRRVEVLDMLHARILDSFNEHGVQIMSPHYMADPAAPKIVPRSDWYAAPASRTSPRPEPAAADISLRS